MTHETQSLNLWIDTKVNKIKDNYDGQGNIISTDYETIHTPKSSGDLTFENDKLHMVTLKKVDAETDKGLAGAKFDVYLDGTKIHSNMTTNASGEIVLGTADVGVQSGYYEFVETAAPAGYVLPNDTTHGIELDATNTTITSHVITVENSAYPDIVVTKYHAGTQRALAGATFKVSIDNKVLGEDFTTGKDGTFTISYSKYSDYLDMKQHSWTVTVEELTAPDGYVLNEELQTKELVRGLPILKFAFENEPYPGILITKQEAGTTKYLPGASYDVDIDGAHFGSFTTDSNGQIVIEFAEFGDFLNPQHDYWTITVQETEAPEGYMLNDTPQTAKFIEGQEWVEFSFENEPFPDIVIEKVHAGTEDGLAGGQFKVEIDGRVVGTSFTTDKDGQIHLTYKDYAAFINPEQATWTVTATEIEPPDGYLLNDTPQTKEITWGQDEIFFRFGNEPMPGLLIVKQEEGTNINLAGATFDVEIDATHFGSFTTDENGRIHIGFEEFGDFLDDTQTKWTVTAKETKAPDGYLLDKTPQSAEFINGQELVELSFENVKMPSIIIEKFDIVDNKPLAGATFQVSIDAQSVGSYQSDKDGKIVIDYDTYKNFIDITKDSWTVRVEETVAPNGYYLSDTPWQEHELNKGQTPLSFTFKNKAAPTIVVEKRDEKTNALLSGATFKINIDDATLGTFTTDSTGKIIITHDVYGQYLNEDNATWLVQVTEITAPEHYFGANPASQENQMKKGQALSPFVFTNQEYPNVVVEKVDSETQKPLAGATFTLTHKDDTVAMRTGKTDSDGKIIFEHVQEGVYTLKETVAPDNYFVESAVQTVIVKPGCDQVLTYHFENDRKPTLEIIKLDAVTKDPLQHAKFLVERKEGHGTVELGTYTTDENGSISFVELESGWYTVTETDPPDGYQVGKNNVQTFYLDGNVSKTVTFENNPLHALIIKKTDSATGKGLAGATFRVSYLSGASGTGGTVIGETFTTTANGTVTITRLQPGTYTVEEISAPDGYTIDTTPKTVYLTDNEQSVVTVEFTNSQKGELIIVKVDSVTKKPLAGAVFKITNSSGTVTDNYGATVGSPTDGNGTVSSNGLYTTDAYGQIKLYDLEPDTYVVTEVEAPAGYVLDSTPQTVRVNTNDTQTLTFGNPPKGNLIIRKIDSITREPLENAEFKVTTSGGCFVGNDGGAVTSNGIYYTDENGEILITALDPSTIVVTETKAPDGYVLDKTPQTVKVNTNDTQTLTFSNTPIGGLTILKTDEATGKRLSGAEFEIREMNGKIIGKYTTDKDGKIYLPELTNGWYVATEIKAPNGYKRATRS